MAKKLSKGRRLWIRRQKAEIRKNANSSEEATTQIKALLNKIYKDVEKS